MTKLDKYFKAVRKKISEGAIYPNQDLLKVMAMVELMRDALDRCANEVDTDYVKTKTEDGEEEYWVSQLQITSTVDEALNRLDELASE